MTDIDEVNNVIQETDEEAYEETYALDFEFTEERVDNGTVLFDIISVKKKSRQVLCCRDFCSFLPLKRLNNNVIINPNIGNCE